MRKLHRDEMYKRGCIYCLDVVKKKTYGQRETMCPFDKCPYDELDEFRTYNEYIKSKGDLLFLKEK
jgi:hypothetical protein